MSRTITPRRLLFSAKQALSAPVRAVRRLPAYKRLTRWFWSGVVVGEASEEDVRKIRDWGGFQRSGMSLSPHARFIHLVAKRGRRILGFLEIVHQPPGSHPLSGYYALGMRVRYLYRGMGIGEALSRAGSRKVRQEGGDKIWLLVHENNRQAISLYRKMGCEVHVVPELEPHLERNRNSLGARQILMVKHLRQGPARAETQPTPGQGVAAGD